MPNQENADGSEQKRLREAKLQRLTELIRRDEYEVDEKLLADAILQHLGLKPAGRRNRRL